MSDIVHNQISNEKLVDIVNKTSKRTRDSSDVKTNPIVLEKLSRQGGKYSIDYSKLNETDSNEDDSISFKQPCLERQTNHYTFPDDYDNHYNAELAEKKNRKRFCCCNIF